MSLATRLVAKKHAVKSVDHIYGSMHASSSIAGAVILGLEAIMATTSRSTSTGTNSAACVAGHTS